MGEHGAIEVPHSASRRSGAEAGGGRVGGSGGLQAAMVRQVCSACLGARAQHAG